MLMGIREVFHFELLGAFSCGSTEEEKTKNSELINGMGKKVRSFLQYLIVNHTRSVSSEELIDQFWADNSRNPANALRNMLFKARQLLREMLILRILKLGILPEITPLWAFGNDFSSFQAVC